MIDSFLEVYLKKSVVMIYLSAVLIFALSLPVGGAEYYQYTDKDGNLCFTDNKAEIPEDQLDQMKSYKSVKSVKKVDSLRNKQKAEEVVGGRTIPNGNTWDGTLRSKAVELEKEQKRLDITYRDLIKKKIELQEKTLNNMPENKKNAYKKKIIELNRQIQNYRKERQEFENKIGLFKNALN